jgi:hypothetical protein
MHITCFIIPVPQDKLDAFGRAVHDVTSEPPITSERE